MNTFKKICRKNGLIEAAICFCIGLVVFFIWGFKGIYLINPPEITKPSELSAYEGKFVKVDVSKCISVYEEIAKDNSTVIRYNGYAITNEKLNSNKNAIFGVWRDVSYEKHMDKIVSLYYDDVSVEKELVTGLVVAMDSDDKGYFNKIVDLAKEVNWELTPTYYYVFENMADKSGSRSIIFIIIIDILAGIIILAGIVLLLISGRGWDKKISEYIVMHPGISKDILEADVASGRYFNNSSMVVTEKRFYYCTKKVFILDMEKVCWGYHYYKRTGRTTVSQLTLFGIDGKPTRVNCSEPIARDVLNAMAKKCPWIIVGYKAEWERIFKNSVDEFLRLHYYEERQRYSGNYGSTYEDPIDAYERQQKEMDSRASGTENYNNGTVSLDKKQTENSNDDKKSGGADFSDFDQWMKNQ